MSLFMLDFVVVGPCHYELVRTLLLDYMLFVVEICGCMTCMGFLVGSCHSVCWTLLLLDHITMNLFGLCCCIICCLLLKCYIYFGILYLDYIVVYVC